MVGVRLSVLGGRWSVFGNTYVVGRGQRLVFGVQWSVFVCRWCMVLGLLSVVGGTWSEVSVR